MSTPLAVSLHTRELDEALAGRIRFARSVSGKPRE
jgi:hypothetical protein